MHGMMDFQLVKQRREVMVREVERNRLAKELRNSRKRRDAGRTSSAAWELKRIAGRLRKLLRSSVESHLGTEEAPREQGERFASRDRART